MKSTYRKWLERQRYAEGTVETQISRIKRVENHYGDLDGHYDEDRLEKIIGEFKYSAEDERRKNPNPTKIPFKGNTRNSIASYRSAVARYRRFREETLDDEHCDTGSEVSDEATNDKAQLFGLERDMQRALRDRIGQLEPELEIIDDGAERHVSSGFIDITAKDAVGKIAVIELKTGTARQKSVAQILSYMGDIEEEEPDATVRGILVAADFDDKARSAARVVPTLSLRSYRVNFKFTNTDEAPDTSRTWQ